MVVSDITITKIWYIATICESIELNIDYIREPVLALFLAFPSLGACLLLSKGMSKIK